MYVVILSGDETIKYNKDEGFFQYNWDRFILITSEYKTDYFYVNFDLYS